MPWDHPRVRGEKASSVSQSSVKVGSPPRVRGKERQDIQKRLEGYITPRARGKDMLGLDRRVGRHITPACAGKRKEVGGANPEVVDHPRVRGEKPISSLHDRFDSQSPPRARGKVDPLHELVQVAGITPACAGKSDDAQPQGIAPSGSPPRVRGKACLLSSFSFLSGITPACAGKSPSRAFSVSTPRDHPRVCGEKPGAVSELGEK